MRRAHLLLLAALIAGPCPAQTILLDSFNAGSATGAVIATSSWAGNVTQNATSITVGGTATDVNGWRASGLAIDATGMGFLTITARRDTGNTASNFTLQFEDRDLNTHVITVDASAFAVGTLTQVQVPLSALPGEFSVSQIAGWSLGGGGVGLDTFHLTLEQLSLSATPLAGVPLAPVGTATLGVPITGTAGLTLNGPGTLVLGTANNFSGAATISQGTLKLGAAGALPVVPVQLAAGATLDLNAHGATISQLEGSGTLALTGGANLTVAQSANSTFSGIISGTGGLAKSGAGTLTLTGTHTFSGATAITGGAIKLNGSAANSAFTLSGGGMLSGSAALGALTVGSGGILSPGNSPGTVTVSGNATFNSGGTFAFELNNAAGTAGTHWDLLSISGSLTVAATAGSPFNLTLTSLLANNTAGAVINFNSAQNSSYTFVSASGGIVGFNASAFSVNSSGFANSLNGGTWSVAQSGNNLNLQFTASAIPEPSTYAALLAAAAFAVTVLSKRRTSPQPRQK